jgi:hypothetical protein
VIFRMGIDIAVRAYAGIISTHIKPQFGKTALAAGVSLPRVEQAERRYLMHEQLEALADGRAADVGPQVSDANA